MKRSEKLKNRLNSEEGEAKSLSFFVVNKSISVLQQKQCILEIHTLTTLLDLVLLLSSFAGSLSIIQFSLSPNKSRYVLEYP